MWKGEVTGSIWEAKALSEISSFSFQQESRLAPHFIRILFVVKQKDVAYVCLCVLNPPAAPPTAQ